MTVGSPFAAALTWRIIPSRKQAPQSCSWHHRPLHLEILKYLREENVAGATALHCVAGFQGRSQVRTGHLVEAGGELPGVATFFDTDEHVSRVLPKLREMAAHPLIVREKVVIEQGSLD